MRDDQVRDMYMALGRWPDRRQHLVIMHYRPRWIRAFFNRADADS